MPTDPILVSSLATPLTPSTALTAPHPTHVVDIIYHISNHPTRPIQAAMKYLRGHLLPRASRHIHVARVAELARVFARRPANPVALGAADALRAATDVPVRERGAVAAQRVVRAEAGARAGLVGVHGGGGDGDAFAGWVMG